MRSNYGARKHATEVQSSPFGLNHRCDTGGLQTDHQEIAPSLAGDVFFYDFRRDADHEHVVRHIFDYY